MSCRLSEDEQSLVFVAAKVSLKLRELRKWETLLSSDPLVWARTGSNPSALLNAAMQSESMLQECRRWLERHGWH